METSFNNNDGIVYLAFSICKNLGIFYHLASTHRTVHGVQSGCLPRQAPPGTESGYTERGVNQSLAAPGVV